MSENLLNVEHSADVVPVSIDELARDPSTVVATPYPPGSSYFYVDDVKKIVPGCRILYLSQSENVPIAVQTLCKDLYQARREHLKYTPGEIYQRWVDEILRLEDELAAWVEAGAYSKSWRRVSYVDPARKLIAVTEPFLDGHRPRILGYCVRITGKQNNFIDEPNTDKFHKIGKVLYGADWQSEFKAIHGPRH
jgi:hypothetical protein